MWPDEGKKIKGFGYKDAMDIEPREPVWTIDEILTEGFGFLAGPPKANNSPHGGKTVFSLALVLALLEKLQFLGRITRKRITPVLLVNLDQSQQEVSAKYRQMLNGLELRGLALSDTYSMQLPADVRRLEKDIKTLRPAMLIIDPLLRAVGGVDIKDATNTGPIVNELKRLQKQYNMIVMVVHHSIKKLDREKESTSTWLSGSTELDSSWDFCLCLEYEKSDDRMHLRCFFRNFGRYDLYYKAVKDAADRIIRLESTAEYAPNAKWVEIKAALSGGSKTPRELSDLTALSESTTKRLLKNKLGTETRIVGRRGNAQIWDLIPLKDKKLSERDLEPVPVHKTESQDERE
jgi:hypothetical protein